MCVNLPVTLTPGIILGFGLRRYNMSYRDVTFFSFPGELLMRMLQMLVLPLLVSSLITGIVFFSYKHIINLFLKLFLRTTENWDTVFPSCFESYKLFLTQFFPVITSLLPKNVKALVTCVTRTESTGLCNNLTHVQQWIMIPQIIPLTSSQMKHTKVSVESGCSAGMRSLGRHVVVLWPIDQPRQQQNSPSVCSADPVCWFFAWLWA